MKRKIISEKISSKMFDWVESIKKSGKKDLADKILENIMVSGGCITSMYLNEEVNDYDVYFKDMDVLIELIKHYDSKVLSFDGRKRDEYLKEVKDREILGGGVGLHLSIHNLKENQIFLNVSGAGYKTGKTGKYDPIFLSQNAITLKNQIQIVTRFVGKVDEIHKTFDFVHATNYWTYEKGVTVNEAALESILTKDLKYQGSLYPLTSIIRARKFLKRGWHIGSGELLKIMFQISELDLKDPHVLEEQLVGVDVTYFNEIISQLKGNKSIEQTHLFEVIENVFDGYTRFIKKDTSNNNDQLPF